MVKYLLNVVCRFYYRSYLLVMLNGRGARFFYHSFNLFSAIEIEMLFVFNTWQFFFLQTSDDDDNRIEPVTRLD